MKRSPHLLAVILLLFGTNALGQQDQPFHPAPSADGQQPAHNQINVNWLYGSYIPKEVPRQSLSGSERWKLYIRQTYTTPGIYLKTTFFALTDHVSDRHPQWGDDFAGFAKRFGDRQAEFVIQNSVSSLGNGLVGWEPRYDRCRCAGFWPRLRYAFLRNFVTYDKTETAFRPQIMPYLGAFAASALATNWQPGNPTWQVSGYQAAITQSYVGVGVNLLGEFAPEITGILRRNKSRQVTANAGRQP
ncbi:MAG TPA: hypothetical protein VG498_22310 [Terriglobales bacterium]|nr:hypothetical protein [Terriglobales bacterium]